MLVVEEMTVLVRFLAFAGCLNAILLKRAHYTPNSSRHLPTFHLFNCDIYFGKSLTCLLTTQITFLKSVIFFTLWIQKISGWFQKFGSVSVLATSLCLLHPINDVPAPFPSRRCLARALAILSVTLILWVHANHIPCTRSQTILN